MDAQQFLAEFGHVANAPGGITRLRELILSMAAQGRLVTQENTDEPAAVFLTRIQSEKNRLVAAKKIKRSSPFRAIADVEKKIVLPSTWKWARLGEIASKLTDGSHNPPKGSVSGYPMLSGQNVLDGMIDFSNPSRMLSEDDFIRENTRTEIRAGDVMLTIVGTIGRSAVVPPNAPLFALQRSVAVIRTPLLPEYLSIQLRSPVARSYYDTHGKGTAQKGIYLAKLGDMPVSVPPLVEQSRIVAKVDELMTLCDTLEARQQARRKLQNNLRQSTLQAVAAATSPHELQTTWARLADNFGQLFHASEDVKDIQQLAMELAVRGLLTEQRDEDEPADRLLDRISIEQQMMVANGEMKRPKPLPAVDPNNAPFELPRGWAWARFPEVGLFGRGKSKHRPRNDPKLFTPGIYPLVQTGEVARSNGVITEYHSKYSELGLAQSRLWPKETLCITIAANIADSAILGFDACFPDSVVGFIPSSEIRGEVEYFLLFMRTARERLLAFAPSTAQKNINLEILQSVLIPIPPKKEIKRILSRISEINGLCDRLVEARVKCRDLGELLASATVSNVSGIATGQEEEQPAPLTDMEAIA